MSGDPVVRLAGVSVERQGRRVLEDISFSLDAGHFLGVVGPNGAGKTTLLRAMLGLVPIAAGRIEVFGRPPGGASPEVGYVPQRHAVAASFPATVRDVVMMGRLRRLGWLERPRAADRESVARSLARVGMQDRAERPIGRLSGGEQRRVMLAQALCSSQRLLVLDEPTIGLDLPAEQAFYALLRSLKEELGLTVIAVSHDLVALAAEADELVCINRSMHVHGNPEDVVHSHALREAYSCEFNFLAGEIAHHERIGRER
ncbi:MAG TPA: metal ABC transporter ATP-binding protein [Myxococcota bacterium]|nr:metal ABC transporter ATP-binding protein [Myxococcota bacterium]